MFTQKISMDCTQEQYEKFLKPELLKMGYKDDYSHSTNTPCVVNNEDGVSGIIANAFIHRRDSEGRTYLGTFNAPLFLALAAMTDKQRGGYGEWITYDGPLNTPQRIFEPLIEDGQFYNGNWRKATVSEIMERFGEKPKQLTDLDKLAARVEKLEQQEPIWESCKERIAKLEQIVAQFPTKDEPKSTPLLASILCNYAPKPNMKCTLVDIPKYQKPIIDELAIFFDNGREADAIIGKYIHANSSGYVFSKITNRDGSISEYSYDNAILFESIDQYK